MSRRVVMLLALSPLVAAAQPPQQPKDPARASAVPTWEAMVAQYPDDPDLSWSLARTLADEGDPEPAVTALSAHLERWPERPPGAWLVLGGWLQQLGRDEAALDALGEALAREPDSGAVVGRARARGTSHQGGSRRGQHGPHVVPPLA